MSGVGLQPAGTSPAGVGTPALGPASGGVVLRDSMSSTQQSGRFIDPQARQYVFDSFGRNLGTSETRQLVALAVSTNKGSSAVRTLGSELSRVQTITDNFSRRVADIFTDALSDLVTRKLIQIIDITTTQTGGSRASIVIRWTDLTTGVEETISV